MTIRNASVLMTALIAVCHAAHAAPQDKVFTVGNHPVDATAADAVAAKEKAHDEGRDSAFRALLKRIVPVTAYKNLAKLKGANASDYFQGLAIRSERNSATEYIASLDYSFSSDGVRDLLRREGVPFVDKQAPPAVVVPLAVEGEAARRPLAASWTDAWKGLDLENAVTPLKLEAVKPEVQAALEKARQPDGAADRALSGAYGGRPVVVAFAELDPSGAKLTVSLGGRDAVGALNLKRTYGVPDGDLAYAMELAAVVALGAIEGRWKFVNEPSSPWSTSPGSGDPVRLQVEFTGPGQWYEIRQQLLDTPGVEDVREESVSSRLAEVSLTFPGGPERLAAALRPRGLSLRGAGGSWLLRSSY